MVAVWSNNILQQASKSLDFNSFMENHISIERRAAARARRTPAITRLAAINTPGSLSTTLNSPAQARRSFRAKASSPTIPSSSKTKRNREEEDEATDEKALKKTKLHGTECIVCGDVVAAHRFPKVSHRAAQSHKSGVCLDCWQQHLSSNIQDPERKSVDCPQCDEHLEEPDIKTLADRETYHL